jgi:hypothetical protein
MWCIALMVTYILFASIENFMHKSNQFLKKKGIPVDRLCFCFITAIELIVSFPAKVVPVPNDDDAADIVLRLQPPSIIEFP